MNFYPGLRHIFQQHEAKMIFTEERPWGKWEEYINESNYRVKRIIVHSGMRLSLQKHMHRSENWVIVQGKGLFSLNGKLKELSVGDVVNIPVEGIHQVENTGEEDFIFIETQLGKCIETDIVRIKDDWGRT